MTRQELRTNDRRPFRSAPAIERRAPSHWDARPLALFALLLILSAAPARLLWGML